MRAKNYERLTPLRRTAYKWIYMFAVLFTENFIYLIRFPYLFHQLLRMKEER